MGKTYELASGDVMELCNRLMETYHEDLCSVRTRVVCLFVSDEDKEGRPKAAVKLHGRPCYATCRIVSVRDRAAGLADAMILIDKHLWEARLDEKQRAALLDHELTHLMPADTDEDDGAGRPKLEMRHHDWELHGFGDVMERHGAKSVELIEARNFYASTNGQLFFDYTQKSPNMKLVPKSAEAVAAENEDLIEQAIEVLRETKRASTAILQRRLRIGYNRAADLMDILEERGVVGSGGNGPREILEIPEKAGV